LIAEKFVDTKITWKSAISIAKVAQELAIVQRIENTKEVVIEEYYECEAKGKAGVTGDEKGITLGISGDGRKVTKKIF